MLRKRCIDCHVECDIKDLIYHDGFFLCQECFKKDYFLCPNCGSIFYKRTGGSYYCTPCRNLEVPIWENTIDYFPLDEIYSKLSITEEIVGKIQTLLQKEKLPEYIIKSLDYTQIVRNPKLLLRAIRYYLSYSDNSTTALTYTLKDLEKTLKEKLTAEYIALRSELAKLQTLTGFKSVLHAGGKD